MKSTIKSVVTALGDRLLAPILLEQVTAAYRRGWHDGRGDLMLAESTGRASTPAPARRVVGDDLHERWGRLGLEFLAARLREVSARVDDLVLQPSWDVDGSLSGRATNRPARGIGVPAPVSLREHLARQRGEVRYPGRDA